MRTYIYHCKNITGGLNIGDVIQKLPIAKIYSSPVFCLIRFSLLQLLILCIGGKIIGNCSVFAMPQ